MATYQATVTSPRPPDEVFTYLADFRSVADWDPSIVASVHLNAEEPIVVGAMYRVTTKTTAKEVVLEYTTQELERPSKIVLRGENDSMISIDTITIEPTAEGGSSVTYLAEIELKGARKLADPLMALGLHRLGDKARDGLAEQLNDLS
jgi:uncharacterized protein YndB with AHSA1/START domain